jgi:energy-coupling factor transporter transmembrane protein EcfT
MDARCYAGSKNRTKYKKSKFTYRDLLGVIAIAGLITGIVFLNKFMWLGVVL